MTNILFAESLAHQLGTLSVGVPPDMSDGGFYSPSPSGTYVGAFGSGGSIVSRYCRCEIRSLLGWGYAMPTILPVVTTSVYIYPEATRYASPGVGGDWPVPSGSGGVYGGNAEWKFAPNNTIWCTVLRIGKIILQIRPIPVTNSFFDAIRVAYDATPSAPVPLAQFAFLFYPHSWFHVEFKVDHTNNRIQVKVDEVMVIDHAIVNSNALADTNNQIGLMNGQSSSAVMYAPPSMYISNWIAADDWVGKAYVTNMVPTDEAIPADILRPVAGPIIPVQSVNTPLGTMIVGDSDYTTADIIGAESYYKSTNTVSVTAPDVRAVVVNSVSLATTVSTRATSNAIFQAPILSPQNSLLHFEGTDGSSTFTDDSGIVWTPTGGTVISTARKAFGTSSGLFNGSGAYLTSASGINLNSVDYTLECMAYFDASTYDVSVYNGRTLFSNFTAQAAGRIFVSVNRFGAFVIGEQSANGTTTVSGTSNDNVCPLQQWFHVAAVHSGSNIYLFLNGTIVTTAIGAARSDYGTTLRIGAFDPSNPPFQNYWLGNIDEVRVTVGLARYNGPFTVPASAFTYLGPGNVLSPAAKSIATAAPNLPTSQTRTLSAFSTDPTGAAWSPTTANQVGFGIKVTS